MTCHHDRFVQHMQALNTAGGQHFVGVNFGAMDKYRKPLSAEQWKTCAKSLKVSFLT